MFIARHVYRVSLWLAWVVIFLCAVFLCKMLDWDEGIRGVVATGAGTSALFLAWLVLETVWPMGCWAFGGLGGGSRACRVDPPDLPDDDTPGRFDGAGSSDPKDWAIALNRLSKGAFERGEPETALKHALDSLALAEESGDDDGKAIILFNLSQIHMALEQEDTALACVEKSLELSRKTGNRTCQEKALDIMGHIYKGRETVDRALSCFKEALAIAEAMGDKEGAGDILNSMGLVHLLCSEADSAKRCLDQSIAIRRAQNDRVGESENLINLSRYHELKGDWDEAEKCLDQSFSLNRKMNNAAAIIAVFYNMAREAMDDGRYDKALMMWDKSLSLAVECGYVEGICHVASTLGGVLATAGHLKEAGYVLKLASETAHAAGFPDVNAIDERLADVYLKQRESLELKTYLSLFSVMTCEKDLVDAGLWFCPVRVLTRLPQYENVIKDSTCGLIGWLPPVSADIFDMTRELPVMFDKDDGSVVCLGIAPEELELIKAGDLH